MNDIREFLYSEIVGDKFNKFTLTELCDKFGYNVYYNLMKLVNDNEIKKENKLYFAYV
jgi:hypothetical protein